MCYLMFSAFESLVHELPTWCFKSSSGLCGEVWGEVFLCMFVVYAERVSDSLRGFVVDWLVFVGVD